MNYLIALGIAISLSYFLLAWLFSFFFTNTWPKITRKAIWSVLLIAISTFVAFQISLSIPNIDFGDRILHAFGGGFLVMFICFLVVKDIKLPISRFQFFVFSALVATALGVANELAEFFLQHYYFPMTFSKTITDTWLDLLSNTVGIIIGSTVFVPFIKKLRDRL